MGDLPSAGPLAGGTGCTIAAAPFDSEWAQWVVGRAEDELVARYGFLVCDEVGLATAEFAPPGGAFLVATVPSAAQPIGGVGVRPTPASAVGEIKRLWVDDSWRGRGVARALMSEIEYVAHGLGLTALRLETGEQQPEAIALYASSGWARQIVDWDGGALPSHSIRFAKDLTLP